MNPPLFHTKLSDAEFWNLALKEVLTVTNAALNKFGTARIGLSGGRTPKHLYELLAEENLPWDKITFILLDERYVPVTDPESNLGMIQTALFDKTSGAKILSFDTTKPAPDAAVAMARELISLTDLRQPLFDLLILGAGKDGHIASLFEEDKALECREYAYVAHAVGYPTETRLTACLFALESSAHALLLLQGEEKRPVLESLKGATTLKLTALRHLMEKMPLTVLTDLSV